MIRLADLRDEALLVEAERRDSLAQARHALLRNDKRAPFTEAELVKRASRLPRLAAISRGLAALEARADEAPEWIVAAFEGAS